jgi:hypothetical protein
MRATTPPMNLGKMHANGVRGLAVHCGGRDCWHVATMNVDAFPDDVAVPAFGPRMRYQRCGYLGAEVMPNWNERARQCLFGAADRQ